MASPSFYKTRLPFAAWSKNKGTWPWSPPSHWTHFHQVAKQCHGKGFVEQPSAHERATLLQYFFQADGRQQVLSFETMDPMWSLDEMKLAVTELKKEESK